MDDRRDQTRGWVAILIKLALSLAVLFPVYTILYVTFPASIVAVYVISAVLFAVFAPWEKLKKTFLS